MADFTHDFDIVYDSKKIHGEVEFNADGKVSYSFANDPDIGLEESALINQLFSTIQQLYHLYDGLEKVKIIQKVV